jgi:hypothetical protein
MYAMSEAHKLHMVHAAQAQCHSCTKCNYFGMAFKLPRCGAPCRR